MGSFKTHLLAGVFTAVTGSAFAADLLPPPPPPMEPLRPAIADFGDGWYLRGDVGASSYQNAKFSQPDVTAAAGSFLSEDFGSGGFAGVGIGYQFNNWLRADITGEYRYSSTVGAVDRFGFTSVIGGVSTPFQNNNYYKGNYAGAVGLVNIYADLGTWYGITPFVGAGVGFAYNQLNGFTDQAFNTNLSSGVTGVSGGYIQDGTKTNFAWALHAGLGYDVTPNLKLEVAYRYLNLGDAKTGTINCFCGGTSQGLKIKDIQSHDFKIGMRWLLAGPVAMPPPPPPIITKY